MSPVEYLVCISLKLSRSSFQESNTCSIRLRKQTKCARCLVEFGWIVFLMTVTYFLHKTNKETHKLPAKPVPIILHYTHFTLSSQHFRREHVSIYATSLEGSKRHLYFHFRFMAPTTGELLDGYTLLQPRKRLLISQISNRTNVEACM